MRQEHRRDLDVVIDDLALGEPDFRVKHLVQVRDRKLFPFDNELGFLGHYFSSTDYADFRRLKRNQNFSAKICVNLRNLWTKRRSARARASAAVCRFD